MIAQQLEQSSGDKIITVEMVMTAGGIRSADAPEYVFSDGSKCWMCPLHGAFFDFGMGCCLPD